MSLDRETERQVRTLQRIAATLLSFAVIAEKAASRSPAVRFLILWLLRQADSVVWNHCAANIDEEYLAEIAVQVQRIETDDSVAQALQYAVSYRMLAALLIALIEDALAQMALGRESLASDRLAILATGLAAALGGFLSAVPALDSS